LGVLFIKRACNHVKNSDVGVVALREHEEADEHPVHGFESPEFLVDDPAEGVSAIEIRA
jgi:hypothetical protein